MLRALLERFASHEPAETPALLESLEDRRLLSADVLSVYPAVGTAAETLVAPAAVANAAVINVVGRYTGTFKVKGIPQAIPAELNIKKQSAKGVITGTISSPGIGITNFAAKGNIDKNGNFTISFDKNGIKGTIKGKVAKNGNLSGTFTADAPPAKAAGTFAFTKVKK